MPGFNMNTELDAGPVQLGAVPVRCWARISEKFLYLEYPQSVLQGVYIKLIIST